MKQKKLCPFGVESLELELEAIKAGVFTLNPQVTYSNEQGETCTCKPRPVTVAVRQMLHARIGQETISVPVLPNRVTTGFKDLDVLLFGGFPEKSAIMLVAPNIDETNLLITRFLSTGAKANEATFYVTVEAANAKTLAQEHPANFSLLLCNIEADTIVQDLPNVFKAKGVESLTEIDIMLTKAMRTIGAPVTSGRKRICFDIISDALLQHHAVNTRRWLSALLPKLKAKGFTVLATINPQMHPPEDVQAVLGLFDGEIRVIERETAKGTERVLKIRKLQNQKYLESELYLSREKFEG
jgi:KaiC/GvpD/RAD55 family RecA-like ATPase